MPWIRQFDTGGNLFDGDKMLPNFVEIGRETAKELGTMSKVQRHSKKEIGCKGGGGGGGVKDQQITLCKFLVTLLFFFLII